MKKIFHSHFIDSLWEFLIILLLLLELIFLPLKIVFKFDTHFFFNDIEKLMLVVFATDFIMRVGMHFINKNTSIKDYLKTWFTADFLAAVPFEIILNFFLVHYSQADQTSPYTNFLNLFRLLRFPKLFRIGNYWKKFQLKQLHNPILVQSVFFSIGTLMATHWITCGWIWVREGYDLNNAFNTYINAFYWCVTTLTTVGYGDITPASNGEKIYAMFVMIFGVGIYGYIIGNIANIIANINIAYSHFTYKMQEINNFSKKQNIPKNLQKEMQTFHHYTWENNTTNKQLDLLSNFPESLQNKIIMFLNRDIVKKVPFFREAKKPFIKDIIKLMDLVTYLPNDTIVKKNEKSKGLFFINKGTLIVLDEKKNKIISHLKEGQSFGEVSFLENQKTPYTIKTKGFCVLYLLNKKDIERLLKKHPAFKEHIIEVAQERKKKNKGDFFLKKN